MTRSAVQIIGVALLGIAALIVGFQNCADIRIVPTQQAATPSPSVGDAEPPQAPPADPPAVEAPPPVIADEDPSGAVTGPIGTELGGVKQGGNCNPTGGTCVCYSISAPPEPFYKDGKTYLFWGISGSKCTQDSYRYMQVLSAQMVNGVPQNPTKFKLSMEEDCGGDCANGVSVDSVSLTPDGNTMLVLGSGGFAHAKVVSFPTSYRTYRKLSGAFWTSPIWFFGGHLISPISGRWGTADANLSIFSSPSMVTQEEGLATTLVEDSLILTLKRGAGDLVEGWATKVGAAPVLIGTWNVSALGGSNMVVRHLHGSPKIVGGRGYLYVVTSPSQYSFAKGAAVLSFNANPLSDLRVEFQKTETEGVLPVIYSWMVGDSVQLLGYEEVRETLDVSQRGGRLLHWRPGLGGWIVAGAGLNPPPCVESETEPDPDTGQTTKYLKCEGRRPGRVGTAITRTGYGILSFQEGGNQYLYVQTDSGKGCDLTVADPTCHLAWDVDIIQKISVSH